MSCISVTWKCAVGLLLVAVFTGCVRVWMSNKRYVFSAEEIDAITQRILQKTEVGEVNKTLTLVEQELRKKYGSYILPAEETEWLFMNCGGWMGSMYLLHASLTEYVLFFGTAIDTSGHSGRYWANITDTMVSGSYRQWVEGGMKVNHYKRGDLVVHQVGEATGLQWSGGTWMVEYGRGFIPSTLLFALADNLFSTTDHYLLYKVLRVYAVSIVRGVFQGNL